MSGAVWFGGDPECRDAQIGLGSTSNIVTGPTSLPATWAGVFDLIVEMVPTGLATQLARYTLLMHGQLPYMLDWTARAITVVDGSTGRLYDHNIIVYGTLGGADTITVSGVEVSLVG